jgi:replicative DNA helicase
MDQLVSIESERAVIGAIMLSGRAYDEAAGIITAEHFAMPQHVALWRACSALANEGKPRDLVSVAEWLDTAGELEQAGGLSYIGEIAANTPSAANAKMYAEIVRDRSLAREVAAAAADCVEIANGEGKARERLDAAQARFMAVQADTASDGPRTYRDILPGVIDQIDERFQSDGSVTGVATGFDEFDRLVNGLEPGSLYIIAGRPSMGKTTFAMNICEHVAQDGLVQVFSLEMPADQLATRSIASLGRVPLQELRTGNIQELNWPKVTAGVARAEALQLEVEDAGGMTVAGIASRARAAKRKNGGKLALVMIDYLQLLATDFGRKPENRTQEIGAMSRALKQLAKELNVPVVCLSQLNRGLEQRNDKRPVMSDLRESGNIEQDADVIAFVYRDEVYTPESPDKGTAEIIVRKQRNGELGTARLAFRGEFTRFDNLARAEVDAMEERRNQKPAASGYRYAD